MRTPTKMMLMATQRSEARNDGMAAEQYGARSAEANYAESRFRDRRGREHYDSGRYAPMRGEANSEMDMRRDMRGEMRDYLPPPVYERMDEATYGNMARNEANYGRMERPVQRIIGFGRDEEIPHSYQSDATYSMGGSAGSHKSNATHGKADGKTNKLDKEMAEEWMRGLENADGSKGPHWTLEQVEKVAEQRNWKIDPIEAWVAMNAVYSDYCHVAKANSVSNMDFYVEMAKAFVEDHDAKPGKLALYYEHIVK